ncbi:MAG: hypothetical protein ACLSAP_05960 [Oscillospiraceae bacterium]
MEAWVVLALLLGICLLIDAQIRPTVKTMGLSCETDGDTVYERRDSGPAGKSEIPYDGLVKVTFDDSKNVTAVKPTPCGQHGEIPDSRLCVLRSLRDMEQADLKIPLGTLMGWQIFSAKVLWSILKCCQPAR